MHWTVLAPVFGADGKTEQYRALTYRQNLRAREYADSMAETNQTPQEVADTKGFVEWANTGDMERKERITSGMGDLRTCCH